MLNPQADPPAASAAVLTLGDAHRPLELGDEHRVNEVNRWPLIAVALFAFAGLLALALWQYNQPTKPRDIVAQLETELGAIPQVAPVELKTITAQAAIEANAAIPIIADPVPAARGFAASGPGGDVARAIDCLAATIWYEAANEPEAGQRAVAQVVLNRVRHPAFPKTVCGVVFQGHERRTGCQFSYTCDGSLVRRPSTATWDKMRFLASEALSGKVFAAVGWATHYHANYVLPYWASSLDKVSVQGAHLFYRWKGGWGTGRAFVGRYAGVELSYPKLGLLSTVHRTGNAALDAAAIASITANLSGPAPNMPATGPIAAATATSTGFSDTAQGQFILAVAPGTDPSSLPGLAAKTCGDRPYCKLMVWAGTARMAKSYPMSDEQASSAAFSYLRNREQAFEKPLWNCAIYPREDRKQCMRKRVVVEGKALDLIPDAPEPDPEPTPKRGARADGLTPDSPDASGDTASAKPSGPQPSGRRRPGSGN